MCILLLEDESLIREIITFELDDQGFEVCEAETGDQAVELIKNPQASLDDASAACVRPACI